MKLDTGKRILFAISGILLGLVIFLYLGPKTEDAVNVSTGEEYLNKMQKFDELELEDKIKKEIEEENMKILDTEENELLNSFNHVKSYHRYILEKIRQVGRSEPIRYARVIRPEPEEEDNTDNDSGDSSYGSTAFNGADYNDGKYDKPNYGSTAFNGADYNDGKYDKPKNSGLSLNLDDFIEKPNKDNKVQQKPEETIKKPVETVEEKDNSTTVNGYDMSNKKEMKVKTGKIEAALRKDGFFPVNKKLASYGRKFGKTSNGFNPGIEIVGDIAGSEVYAISSGIVAKANLNDKTYGNLVVIEHDGFQSYYGSLEGLERNISPGTLVNAGDIIGYVGNTKPGSTEHRLYLELEQNNVKVDPTSFLTSVITRGTSQEKNTLDIELNKTKK